MPLYITKGERVVFIPQGAEKPIEADVLCIVTLMDNRTPVLIAQEVGTQNVYCAVSPNLLTKEYKPNIELTPSTK